MNLKKAINNFDEYCKQFDMSNFKIKQRYEHTYRVMQKAHDIAVSLNLNEDDVNLASLIGLLHDIGRFHQLSVYATINDKKTIDHADYGAEILFCKNLITKFHDNEDDYEIIKKSIRNHNKVSLEPNLTERELLFSKIIRDADKLDILYIIDINHELPKTLDEVTKPCEEYFLNKKIIPYHYIESLGDKVLIYLCYVYDINFKYSFRYIKDNNLYENIYNGLDKKELFNKYFTYVYKYIDERI